MVGGPGVLDWIGRLPRHTTALDLGCGKLRYSIPLARRIRVVVAVDSRIQVDREQMVNRKTCSVREYASRALKNVKVYASDECFWKRLNYDVVVCTNVLSAIPSQSTREHLIASAYRCLKPGGQLLLTTQFRNSHYSGWKSNPRARPYLDGFIVKGLQGASFYGLIDAASLRRLCKRCGFRAVASGHVGELAFVVAERSRSRRATSV